MYQVGDTHTYYLQCTDKSGHIVSHHWQYPGDGGQFRDDPDMRIVAVTNVTPCCRKVTIELSGDAAKYQSDVAGDYVLMDKFSTGRHIYQHKIRNLFLHIAPRTVNWSVSSTIGIDTEHIGSGAAGSLCPADPRNTYSHVVGRKSWVYRSGSDEVEAGPGNIRLTCTKNN